MDLIDTYPLTRQAHIGLVIASGTLFALRGVGVLSGARWSMQRSVRIASQIIDSGLLIAAMLLLAMLQLNPFVVPWLATKLALLVVYIVLGSLALKRARSARARLACFIAALLTFAFMLGVARAHHPLGLLHGVS
ncbi:invasion expression up-regulator, SirB family protein [Methyloversatilis sp. RAC08]|uniref:SirB2 family protein n=1 Tax=Methyloversatilis sp. RAC08 TaxID=1842540 RepID=UPI0008552FE8|nr:SirB2 family protein [Methyloversatilis sp. RAC08]AOF82602.1 invasion expression up-regulator, SirB family protein [Methyloversatilis sp. RAC08]